MEFLLISIIVRLSGFPLGISFNSSTSSRILHQGHKKEINMNTKDQDYGRQKAVDMIAKPEDIRDEADSNLLTGLKELQRFLVADGYVVMAEQLRGTIGFSAVGPKAWATLNTLVSVYRFSPFEIYRVLGGDPQKAPAWLVGEQAVRYLGNPNAQRLRPLPSLDQIVDKIDNASSPMLGAFSQEVGIISGACCISGSTPCLDYFEDYFQSYSAMFNNGVSWANQGANKIDGNGTWQNGDVNLNLKSTSAGVAVVCFCEEQGYKFSPTITVQEYIGSGLWLDIWSGDGFTGTGIGILFKGIRVRRVRLLVRGNQANKGKSFSWGASY
jgi:hypothetical protein